MAHKSLIEKGPLVVRIADGAADMARILTLRAAVFRAGASDEDRFDPLCRHVLIENRATGRLAGCYRLFEVAGEVAADESYSAQFYDLSGLARQNGPMLELGRFCLAPGDGTPFAPGTGDGDALRLAWAGLTRLVDDAGARMLFGCTSFAGTDPAPYRAAFNLLAAGHLAPEAWRAGMRAGEVVRFSPGEVDRAGALAAMPPLLRSYLGIGGLVSDHAVIDRDLDTLHVFTGLDVAKVPAARVRALRAIAAS